MSKDLIGRICIKLSGREANKTAVIVDILENNFVLIDGNVKRRKCNIGHLEITNKKIEIEKNAPTSLLHEAMKKANIQVIGKKEKIIKEKKVEEKNEKPRTKKKVPRVSTSHATSRSTSTADKHNKQ